METLKTSASHSTLREWSNFMNVLSSRRNSSTPLLTKAETPRKIIDHLQKQFTDDEPVHIHHGWYTVQKVKRKPVMPGQLEMQFV
jgi:hypothetical protein